MSLLTAYLVSSVVVLAKEVEAGGKVSLKMQFWNSLKCIFTQCGWPAIIIIIIPALAVYIWKKLFSLG